MDIEKLKKLQEVTKLSFQECMKALKESNYDFLEALKMLKEKSVEISSKGEKNYGLVVIKQKENKIIAFILRCQTDFVALNQNFQETANNIKEIFLNNFDELKNQKEPWKSEDVKQCLEKAYTSLGESISLEDCHFIAKEKREKVGIYVHHNKQVGSVVILQEGDESVAYELALQLAANKPKFLSLETIPVKFLESKKKEIVDLTKEENTDKLSNIIEKIAGGKIEKYLSSVCFLEQPDLREPKRKIKDYLKEKGAKITKFYLLNLKY